MKATQKLIQSLRNVADKIDNSEVKYDWYEIDRNGLGYLVFDLLDADTEDKQTEIINSLYDINNGFKTVFWADLFWDSGDKLDSEGNHICWVFNKLKEHGLDEYEDFMIFEFLHDRVNGMFNTPTAAEKWLAPNLFVWPIRPVQFFRHKADSLEKELNGITEDLDLVA